jgi:hypothetical protein
MDSLELIKLAFPFAMLVGGGVVLVVLVKGARNYLHIQRSYVPRMLIFMTIPSVVFLGLLKILSQDAVVAIIGSIVGYSLGSIGGALGRDDDNKTPPAR